MAFLWTRRARARHDRAVLTLLALLMTLWGGAPAWATTVTDVAVTRNRVVIRFDAPVAQAAAQVLKATGQMAVDVTGAKPGRVAASVAQQVRRGNGTRVLIDLPRPVVVSDGGFDADGRALVLSLRTASAAEVAASAPLNFFPFDVGGWTRRARPQVSMPVPPAARALPLPRVRGNEDRPLVVIDAGHGGVDPGAISPTSGLREKDVTLKLAKAIRDELVRSGRVRVALTRDDDRYLVLRERYGIARRLHADLFISVHCDSTGSEDATGASVYTLSEVASDKEAARLAARENKADVIAGVDLGGAGADVRSILIDLTQRETMNSSATFARLLGREAKPLIPTKPQFHRMASLMVLKAPDMPSILFETGYISNPSDAAFLDSADGRERIAESIERAVAVHFARRMAAR